MNWSHIWIRLFGTTSWLGLDVGFWVSMGISVVVALLMIVVFWAQKPYQKPDTDGRDCPDHVIPMTRRHRRS